MSSIIGDIFRGVGELIGGAADFVGDLVFGFGESDSEDILIVAMLGSALAWYLGRKNLKGIPKDPDPAARINYLNEAARPVDQNPLLKYKSVDHVLRKLLAAHRETNGKSHAVNKIKMDILNTLGIGTGKGKPGDIRSAVFNSFLAHRPINNPQAFDADLIKWLKDNNLQNMLDVVEDRNNRGAIFSGSMSQTPNNEKKLYNAFYRDYKNIDPTSIKPFTYNGRTYNIFSDMEKAVLDNKNVGFNKILNEVIADSKGENGSLFNYIVGNQYDRSGDLKTLQDFVDYLRTNPDHSQTYDTIDKLYEFITDPSTQKSLEDINIKPPKFSMTDALNIISSQSNNAFGRELPNKIRRIGKAGTILSAIAKAMSLIFF